MTKLYFYMGAMNCGKTASLLQTRHNYKERGMYAHVYIPDMFENVSSRIGLKTDDCYTFSPTYTFDIKTNGKIPSVILVDEAQFLTKKQVWELANIAVKGCPVICFGLRTDFKGEPFEGSMALLSIADKIIELKTICWCGKKATMNLRLDNNHVMETGEQVDTEKDKYLSVCMKHFLSKQICKKVRFDVDV